MVGAGFHQCRMIGCFGLVFFLGIACGRGIGDSRRVGPDEHRYTVLAPRLRLQDGFPVEQREYRTKENLMQGGNITLAFTAAADADISQTVGNLLTKALSLSERVLVYDLSSSMPRWEDLQTRLQAAAATDAPLAPIVQIIPYEDFTTIRDGVVQRGRTLVRFLQDIYSGRWDAVNDGVIPASVVNKALQLQGYDRLVGTLPAAAVTISYGPDISYHNGYVIEDNIGDLGGRQGIFVLQRVLHEVFPELGVREQASLFREYIDRLRAVMPFPDLGVAYWADPAFSSFHAFTADEEQYERAGIPVVAGQKPGERYFRADPAHGLMLMHPDGETQRIGFLLYDDYDIALDADDPMLSRRRQELGYEKIHTGIPGIMPLVEENRVLVSHAPGSCLADCKLIYPFVEELIRYYLHEEPLLKSTKAYALWDGYGLPLLARADRERMKDGLVLKPVRGESGEGVVVGRFASGAQWKAALDTAAASPEEYLLFEYVEPLHIRDYISTHRVLVDVMPDLRVAVYPGVYARVTPAQGRGVIGDHPDLIEQGIPRNLTMLTLVEGITVTRAVSSADILPANAPAHTKEENTILRVDIPEHLPLSFVGASL